MSEELTVEELKQKIKASLDADIDRYVGTVKQELPTLSGHIRERFSAEPEDVKYEDYFPTPQFCNLAGLAVSVNTEDDPRDYED
jgi:hypothetical protein